MDTYAQDVA
jgi:hypothetical protein